MRKPVRIALIVSLFLLGCFSGCKRKQPAQHKPGEQPELHAIAPRACPTLDPCNAAAVICGGFPEKPPNPYPLTGENYGSGWWPEASNGHLYCNFVRARGGHPPYTFQVFGLPKGIKFDGTTGEIFGTPFDTLKTYQVSVQVKDTQGGVVTNVANLALCSEDPHHYCTPFAGVDPSK